VTLSGRPASVIGGPVGALRVLVVLGILASGCAGGGGSAGGEATVHVELEETDQLFIEGFNVIVTFVDGDGEELSTHDWNQDVVGPGAEPDEYYDATLTEQVPAGRIDVVTTMNIGMSEPGEPCTTHLDLEVGADATVTVFFIPQGANCAEVTGA
jgi:hypothetical protein